MELGLKVQFEKFGPFVVHPLHPATMLPASQSATKIDMVSVSRLTLETLLRVHVLNPTALRVRLLSENNPN